MMSRMLVISWILSCKRQEPPSSWQPPQAEALELLQISRPDLLVADIGMPGEDGYELIRKVRASSQQDFARLPAMALTAYARAEERAQAFCRRLPISYDKTCRARRADCNDRSNAGGDPSKQRFGKVIVTPRT